VNAVALPVDVLLHSGYCYVVGAALPEAQIAAVDTDCASSSI
jgi:hypothetical protein